MKVFSFAVLLSGLILFNCEKEKEIEIKNFTRDSTLTMITDAQSIHLISFNLNTVTNKNVLLTLTDSLNYWQKFEVGKNDTDKEYKLEYYTNKAYLIIQKDSTLQGSVKIKYQFYSY